MTHSASLPTPSAAVLRSTSGAAVTLLRVYGEDAFSYLQSQVSTDLRVKGEQWVRYALWLDSRGYVQADSFILRQSEASFLLFSYHTSAERLEEIVLANVIADDVEIEHLGDRYQHWALWADGEADALQTAAAIDAFLPSAMRPQEGCFIIIDAQNSEGATDAGEQGAGSQSVTEADAQGVMDTDAQGAQEVDGQSVKEADTQGAQGTNGQSAKDAASSLPVLLFRGRNAESENYDLLLPAGAALPSFAAGLKAVPWAARQARRITDGVPAVPADVGAGDLPQEGGDLARIAVSTTKGCYLGQEVIARWHATGQVRSGLYRLRLASADSARAVANVLVAANRPAPDTPASDTPVNDVSVGDISVGDAPGGDVSASDIVADTAIEASLPLRLYAGTKPVGQLRSFAPQAGAGLALLRIHRLGDARELSVEAGGAVVFKILEPMLA